VKPLHVRVALFDPVTEETFPVRDGISVSVARLDRERGRPDLDRLPLAWHDAKRCFFVDAPTYRAGRGHFLVVTFHRRNFDRASGRLLDLDEAQGVRDPLYAPARLPDWDTGWDDAYRRNEHFGWRGRQRRSAPDRPIVLRVPIRRFYVVGHRGAPHAYPENTLPAFRAALDQGANALEFDLCLLKDGGIAVFHDAQPVKQPPRVDRTLFEKLPFELVSPTFSLDGRTARLAAVEGGKVVGTGERRLGDRHELDLARITFGEAREVYRYAPVDGVEHRLIGFDAFLDFAAAEAGRLRLLFFDLKPPGSLSDARPARAYARRIAEAVRRRPVLPERLVVAYADAKVLREVKKGFQDVGEERCWFAYDAAGGLSPWIQGLARGWAWLPRFVRRFLGWVLPKDPNPLRIARSMRNEVVSIGRLARPAHVDEIRQAVRDRDYRAQSRVEMVVHWTLNDREEMAHSVESGVNAILTDKPDVLVALLAERGVRVN
jgi:glycerophosphoryl diester phosphodiesterase